MNRKSRPEAIISPPILNLEATTPAAMEAGESSGPMIETGAEAHSWEQEVAGFSFIVSALARGRTRVLVQGDRAGLVCDLMYVPEA